MAQRPLAAIISFLLILCASGHLNGKSVLGNGADGFELGAGAKKTVQLPAEWAGRVWGRTGCDFSRPTNGTPACLTGDCGDGRCNCSGNCSPAGCTRDLNSACPSALQVKHGDNTIACKSACAAFSSPEYCCTGTFGSPQTCKPTDYSRIFKDRCPTAYSYAFDDASSTFTCTNPEGYYITFCPHS
ncbi:hypothetical protein L7F22_065549 [Adiantum nelumboides]|nr:hypothetical protein [Adiantum nelumboides]